MSPTRRELLLGAAGALVLGRSAGATGALANVQQSENLDVALRAERWIRTARVESEHGVVWPADPNTPASVQRALYNGFPGVVVFLLELYHTTGDRRYLDEAVRGASDLAASTPVDAAAVREVVVYAGLSATVTLRPEEVLNQGTPLLQESGESLQRLLHIWVNHHIGVEGDNHLAPVESDFLPILRDPPALNTLKGDAAFADACECIRLLVALGDVESPFDILHHRDSSRRDA